MADMLVKLYNLPDEWSFIAPLTEKGISIRKAIGPEHLFLESWVETHFSKGWRSEVSAALGNRPTTCFIAEKNGELLGFACYDATALGFFGPTGVHPQARGQGIGKALLLACMADMKLKGYGYAIIGDVGPGEFYQKVVNASEIQDSFPGIYRGNVAKE